MPNEVAGVCIEYTVDLPGIQKIDFSYSSDMRPKILVNIELKEKWQTSKCRYIVQEGVITDITVRWLE